MKEISPENTREELEEHDDESDFSFERHIAEHWEHSIGDSSAEIFDKIYDLVMVDRILKVCEIASAPCMSNDRVHNV